MGEGTHTRDLYFDQEVYWFVKTISPAVLDGFYVKAQSGEAAWNIARWSLAIGEAIDSVTPLVPEVRS